MPLTKQSCGKSRTLQQQQQQHVIIVDVRGENLEHTKLPVCMERARTGYDSSPCENAGLRAAAFYFKGDESRTRARFVAALARDHRSWGEFLSRFIYEVLGPLVVYPSVCCCPRET